MTGRFDSINMRAKPSVALFLDAEHGFRLASWLVQQGADIRLGVLHPPGQGKSQERIRELLEGARVRCLHYQPGTPDAFVDQVLQMGVEFEYLASLWFGYILPPVVLKLPTIASFNTHPSYLPHNRGKHPNVWAIMEGTPAGGSVHYMEPGIDSGPVLFRKETPVLPEDTGKSLYERSVRTTEEAFRKAWQALCAGPVEGTPQSELGPTTFHKDSDLRRLDRIDLDSTMRAGDLINWLRARTSSPKTGARFEVNGKHYQIRVEIEEIKADTDPSPTRQAETPGEPSDPSTYRGFTAVNDLEKIQNMSTDPVTSKLGVDFIRKVSLYDYSYNFSWLGRPIIQFPQDILALQEIIWSVRPDLIIETGIAHGGSLVLYASMLELMGGNRKVVGIDREIRPHNRAALENHPLYSRISLIEGSSDSPATISQVKSHAKDHRQVLVVLDSNHSHEHVLRELQLYSPLVTRDSYLIVFDTVIEHIMDGPSPNRPWGKGNNPYTAVQQFMESTDRFVLNDIIEKKLLITVAPGGFLKCIKDHESME